MILKKVVAFVRSYWYIPFVFVTFIMVFIFLKNSDKNAFLNVIFDAAKKHQKLLKQIDDEKKMSDEKKLKEIERAQHVESMIVQEFVKNEKEISDAQRKRVKEIIKKFKDPEKLALEIKKETGFNVIIVD